MSTLAAPVLPDTGGAGSVEGLVWTLADGMSRRGHEVTVYAARGSRVTGRVVETLPGPYGKEGAPGDWHLCEWMNLCRAIEDSARFDVIHSHAYLWGIPLESFSRAPMIHTLHVWPYQDNALLWRRYPRALVTAVSKSQWSEYPDLLPRAVVHHGLDPARFPFQARGDGYACYLGRFIPGKGPLEAIGACRAAGIPLLLAGPKGQWFDTHVAPLVDGRSVQYVGEVTGSARTDLLGGASALVMPLQAPEPFGLVLVEAMMCGAPVVTTRTGATGELVEDGVTGLFGSKPAELAAAVAAAPDLDRSVVRQRAEERFSAGRMVDQYLQLYEETTAGRSS